MKTILLALMALWLGGCTTVAQKNHGQPIVFPSALKQQIEGTKIAVIDVHSNSCDPSGGAVTSASDWLPAKLVPKDQQGTDGYLVELSFWGCEGLEEGASRHLGNFILTAFTAEIIPTVYDTFSNLRARVYKDGKQVYQGEYREHTKHNIFGWVALPIGIVKSLMPTPVNESANMTIYRNLARQFADDVVSEYVFE